MGYIKSPDGIDFLVDPSPLTPTERKKISAIIANYRATGKKMVLQDSSKKQSISKKNKKEVES